MHVQRSPPPAAAFEHVGNGEPERQVSCVQDEPRHHSRGRAAARRDDAHCGELRPARKDQH